MAGAGPLRSLQRPERVIPMTLVASTPPKARAYSFSPSSSRATVGIAVVTARASKAMREIRATMPMVAAR